MLIPLETLVDGLVHTLREEVAPDVGSRFARGQLFAVIDVLANLRNRVEPRADLAAADADAARSALDAAASALRESGRGAEAGRLMEAADAAPAAPPRERAAALRAAVVVALEIVDALPEAEGGAAHRALREYLTPQTVRDVLPLVRSDLGAIARG